VSDTELAWAAGFFDGEGSIMLKAHRVRWREIVMSLTQAELTTLTRFRQAVGQGRIHGPYVYKQRKPHWRWTVEGSDRCGDVLEKLWPYLSGPKRQQAEAVVDRWVEYRNSLTYTSLRRD
jgi:hypothetical protein